MSFNSDSGFQPESKNRIFNSAELALKLKPIIAEKAKTNQISAGGANPVPQNSAEAVDTRKEIAQKAGEVIAK